MDKKKIKWLYGELPLLVDRQIISEESAERLRQYYGDVEEGSGRRMAFIVFAILGAALIGAGIILILAHNWDALSRTLRTFLALAPLISAQSLAGWVIWRRSESAAWREGTATFLVFAVGASIALISQTYHISGGGDSFLLTWMLLSVPLVYLMRANVPALLYTAGITAWSAGCGSGHAFYYWPLAALIVPHFVILGRENLFSNRLIVLSWVFTLSFCVAVGTTAKESLPFSWPLVYLVYCGVFAVLYLGGSLLYTKGQGWWRQPFVSVGAAGITVITFLLTNQRIWANIGWFGYRMNEPGAGNLLLTLGLPLVVVTSCLLAACVRRKQAGRVLLGVAPLVVFGGYIFFTYLASGAEKTGIPVNTIVPAVLFNVYFFILGVNTTVSGIRSGRLGTVNAGMFLLAALVLARFFDSGIGFVIRGVVFIIVGVGFLTTNLVLLRRGRERAV
ncbi:MAG: DUF2157 domain-containing protein [Bacillota bacterium]